MMAQNLSAIIAVVGPTFTLNVLTMLPRSGAVPTRRRAHGNVRRVWETQTTRVDDAGNVCPMFDPTRRAECRRQTVDQRAATFAKRVPTLRSFLTVHFRPDRTATSLCFTSTDILTERRPCTLLRAKKICVI